MVRFLLLLSAAYSLSAAEPNVVVIEHALLIAGEGGAPMPDASILIENGRISRIAASGGLPVPVGAETIDASGKTVIPGIINVRGHLGLTRNVIQAREGYSRESILRQLETYASFGVTTVASLGLDSEAIIAVRDEVDAGRLAGTARVLTASRGFTAVGSYPTRAPGLHGLARELASKAEARREVDRLARSGADLAHLWVDGRRDSAAPLRSKIFRAVIRRAKRRGLKVSAQAPGLEDAAALARAGADVLTQSVTDRDVDAEFAATLLRAGTIYAPALNAETARFEFGDRADWFDDYFFRRSVEGGTTGLINDVMLMAQALDPDRSKKIHGYEIARRNLLRLVRAGVPIALGSGSGLTGRFAGYSEYREAVLMVDAGMSPAAVIKAFSRNAAEALGVLADRGTIAEGKRADLVILNANPLEDIRHLRELHAVLIGGRLARL